MNRRLYRSRSDTVLGGVAAGLADYLNIDPALVRIAWAILVLVTGGGALLAYIVAWVIVPTAPPPAPAAGSWMPDDAAGADAAKSSTQPTERVDPGNGGLIVGLILIGAGLWFLAREYLPPVNWALIWPVILIGVGGLVLLTSSRRGRRD